MKTSERFRLWVYPSAWGLPNLSPFCMKLEAWLRLAEIPYERKIIGGPPRSKTGKAPYLELPSGEIVFDSSNIVRKLGEETSLDRDLDEDERAELVFLQRTIEEHLYWFYIHDRWLEERGWKVTQATYFGAIPGPIRALITPFFRRQVKRDARGHGLGRLPKEQLEARLDADLRALEQKVGDRRHYFGRPSSADAILLGFLAGIYYAPYEGLLAENGAKRPGLRAYTDRLYAEVFPDYPPQHGLRAD